MARKFLTAFIGITAIAFSAAAITSVEAKGKKKYGKARSLTIQKRSFLDNGKVPVADETRRYVTFGTHYTTPVYSHQSDVYGTGALPGRFGAFGPR